MRADLRHLTCLFSLLLGTGGFVLAAPAPGSEVPASLTTATQTPAAKPAPSPPQPIQIEADRAEITEQSGVSLYTGNVNLKQGDLEMQGDRLEIRRDSKTGEINAVLTGKQASLRQPTETGEIVKARADRINYLSRDKSLDLQGTAEFERGRDRISGQSIRYDANAKKILASGPNQAGKRVQIIIQPGQTE